LQLAPSPGKNVRKRGQFFLLAVYITGNGIAAYDQTAGLGTLNKMDGDAFSVDKGVAKSNKQVPWS